MRMLFRIGKHDIGKGECGDMEKCAIALGVSRRLQQMGASVAVKVGIGLTYYKLTKKGTLGTKLGMSSFTDNVSVFIDRFDDGRKVNPFSFKTILPPKVAELVTTEA